MFRLKNFLPAHLIPFLILFQLLLLRFQGVQTLFNVLQQVVDLLPFALYKQTTFWSLPLFCHMQKPLCIRNNGEDHPPKKIANSSLECSYAWSVSHTHAHWHVFVVINDAEGYSNGEDKFRCRPVSLKMPLLSSRRSSYTLVPATSRRSFRRCESGAVAIWLI